MFYEFGLQIRRKRICLECVLGCVLYFCFISSQIQDTCRSTKHVQSSSSVCLGDDPRGLTLKGGALISLFETPLRPKAYYRVLQKKDFFKMKKRGMTAYKEPKFLAKCFLLKEKPGESAAQCKQ